MLRVILFHPRVQSGLQKVTGQGSQFTVLASAQSPEYRTTGHLASLFSTIHSPTLAWGNTTPLTPYGKPSFLGQAITLHCGRLYFPCSNLRWLQVLYLDLYFPSIKTHPSSFILLQTFISIIANICGVLTNHLCRISHNPRSCFRRKDSCPEPHSRQTVEPEF